MGTEFRTLSFLGTCVAGVGHVATVNYDSAVTEYDVVVATAVAVVVVDVEDAVAVDGDVVEYVAGWKLAVHCCMSCVESRQCVDTAGGQIDAD